MKRTIRLLAAVAGFALLAQPAFADCGHCESSKSYGSHASKESDEEYKCPLTTKFMKKSHFLLSKSEDLALTPDQVKTIMALKMDVKKQYIRGAADFEILMLDTMAKLGDDQVDTKAVNTMVDQGFASMATHTKALIDSFLKLKSTLTPEQQAKAKALWIKKFER